MPTHKCPCCGNKTLPVPASDALAFICPVCFWENDVFTTGDNEPSDENNGLTLSEARQNYLAYGACSMNLKKYTRPPTESEKC